MLGWVTEASASSSWAASPAPEQPVARRAAKHARIPKSNLTLDLSDLPPVLVNKEPSLFSSGWFKHGNPKTLKEA